MKRKAFAEWSGNLKEGQGKLTTDSRTLAETPYSFTTRFGDKRGTNPEELVAAAHAGCFSMALSGELEKIQLRPDRIETQATVTFEKGENGWSITSVFLNVAAQISGAKQDQFQKAAESAKQNCPISKLLNVPISLDAHLEFIEPNQLDRME